MDRRWSRPLVAAVLGVLLTAGLSACKDPRVDGLLVRVDSLETRLRRQYDYNERLLAVLKLWDQQLSGPRQGAPTDPVPPPPEPAPEW